MILGLYSADCDVCLKPLRESASASPLHTASEQLMIAALEASGWTRGDRRGTWVCPRCKGRDTLGTYA